jgi:hypothetical protein
MTEPVELPSTKGELISFIRMQWNALVDASDLIPDDRWLAPLDAAGWSVRDHVAHVTSWLQAEIPLLSAGVPIPESTGMPEEIWDAGDTEAINEWFRQRTIHHSPAEVRLERDKVFPHLFEVVAAMSDDDLAKPARESGLENSDRPLLEVMNENYGLHFEDHRIQIEKLGAVAS